MLEVVCEILFWKFLLSKVHHFLRPASWDWQKQSEDINQHQSTLHNVEDCRLSSNIEIKHVMNHLHQLGYVNRLDVWVSHKLSKAHLIECISINDSPRKREESDLFLKRTMKNELSTTTLKAKDHGGSAANHHKSFFLPSIWWKGVVFYKLLPKNRTVNSNICPTRQIGRSDSQEASRVRKASSSISTTPRVAHITISPKQIIGTGLGHLTAFSIFTGLCPFRLLSASLPSEFFE